MGCRRTFPEQPAHDGDPLQRATAIEGSLHEEVVQIAECRSGRFLPHIQPQEFEALLFSNTSQLVRERPEWARWAEELAAVRKRAASPEHINDGPETHPSARLERLPGYRKVRHGTAVAKRIGLERIAKSAVTLPGGSHGSNRCLRWCS